MKTAMVTLIPENDITVLAAKENVTQNVIRNAPDEGYYLVIGLIHIVGVLSHKTNAIPSVGNLSTANIINNLIPTAVNPQNHGYFSRNRKKPLILVLMEDGL